MLHASILQAKRRSVHGNERKKANCIIVANTVTGICNGAMNKKCNMPQQMLTLKPISADHTSISGTLSITNIIMASWSRRLWQNVVNRAVRTLASGPFGSKFFSAIGTVGGN
ncbi:hypothetical protein KIN20_010375 [Parelaphostrongylus tenuis]|uniref:Uncharacterized protein n=1 Tax=Parelaphostrongylus tenuis TaxID=148309 RepID=A0AAD5M7S4_PARTN|nr:hypothetical protein KIN20_010375 [Parelaphostrongylus tenuis]